MNLREAMEAQLLALESLDALILQERSLLLAPQPGDILEVLGHKDSALEAVGRATRALTQALAHAGLPASPDAVTAAVAHEPALLDLWTRVRRTMDLTRERNSLNGQLISQRLQFTTARLDALRGAAMRTGVYDQRGRSGEAQPTGRMIAAV
jgi:flagella synthesis protein FlgN